MANVLILADHDVQIQRIKGACDGWDSDALLETARISDVVTFTPVTSRICDVAIIDHDDPIEPRLQAVQHLRSINSAMKVIVTGIPAIGSEDRTELIFSYLEAGVAGYVAENEVEDQLLDVVTEVLRGGTWIEPTMTIQLIQRTVALHEALEMMRPYSAVSGHADMLTRRQQEVLELLASGLTNKEIADELFISVGTVKNHVHRILDVLNASSREQAAQYYQFMQVPTAAA